MPSSKPTRLTDIDISTLETIYADGRAMGRILEDFKDDLAKARAENAELKTELRTMEVRLKRATALYKHAIETAPGIRPPVLLKRMKRLRPYLYR